MQSKAVTVFFCFFHRLIWVYDVGIYFSIRLRRRPQNNTHKTILYYRTIDMDIQVLKY